MRLFVAVAPEEKIREQLCYAVDELQRAGGRGIFSSFDQLHLTLAFIGEAEQAEPVCSAMDACPGRAFSLRLGGAGCFERSGGKTLWCSVESSPVLISLQRQLSEQLYLAGFRVDTRPYLPHITLGRQVVLPEGFCLGAVSRLLPAMENSVQDIRLFSSSRVMGKLTYTELYRRLL